MQGRGNFHALRGVNLEMLFSGVGDNLQGAKRGSNESVIPCHSEQETGIISESLSVVWNTCRTFCSPYF